MSLSSKLAARKNNVAIPETKETAPDVLSIHSDSEGESDSDVLSFDRCLFISDEKLTVELRSKLGIHNDIRPYDDNFVNRTCKDLSEAKLDHLWLNLSEKPAKRWAELNVKNSAPYTTILLHSGSRKNKFVGQLKDHVDLVCTVKQVAKMRALSNAELFSNLADSIDITSPANWLAQVLGCSKSIEQESKK